MWVVCNILVYFKIVVVFLYRLSKDNVLLYWEPMGKDTSNICWIQFNTNEQSY